MINETLSQAIKEAYATAPANVVTLNTLELRHPAFVDEFDQQTALRVVLNNENITARLEGDAPLNPGEDVLFVAMNFSFTLPEIDDSGTAQIRVQIDNVSREIGDNIEKTILYPDSIAITYRPYLSDDLTQPQMDPPLTMEVSDIDLDVFKVTLTAGFADIVNRRFPAELYTAERFPGLVR